MMVQYTISNKIVIACSNQLCLMCHLLIIKEYLLQSTTMDNQNQELTPQQLLKHSKKHPHSVNLSTEAFTVNARDFVVHNVSLKGDPNGDFDVTNYRRGLTFIQQIVNFKEQHLRVGKKGLRKFFDLMPQFLGQKVSHISNSRHYNSIKNKIFSSLDTEAESFFIYSTQKANGENAQISWDQEGQFWVIGSKNKTLLLSELKDTKYLTHKYQHVRTISIAEEWFKYLDNNQDKLEQIKAKLSKFVLIGEICDSVKSGHIVDYGTQVKLYFYALVGKEEKEYSCEPPSQFLEFAKSVNLEKHSVRFNITEVKSFEALKQELKKQMFKIYEGELQKYGEGTVVYITIKQKGEEHCESICKIKTLQYRIYRKLREKLKQFFEKYRKSYDKMLNKFIQQVKQLTKGFVTPKPEEYYFNIGKRAFQFCQNQQKAITKYFHNKYIQFLKLLQNEKIDKQSFKKIVHQEIGAEEVAKIMQQNKPVEKKQAQEQGKQKQLKQQVKKEKNVIVFVPLTVPATGKSTFFKKIKQNLKGYHVEILSSDTQRLIKMQQLMKKQKNLSKEAAFEKSRQSANKQYYTELNQILKTMQGTKQYDNFILFLDKNHPQNCLKKTIQEIRKAADKCKDLNVKISCILPKCQKLIAQKPKYMYPFSTSYVVSCSKRILLREEHQTLEGTQSKRVNVLVNFCNMFRNFAISDYNLSKYFDLAIRLPFTQEQQISEQINQGLIKILLGSKPGSFDEHPGLQQLIEKIKKQKYLQINFDDVMGQATQIISELFQNFNESKINVEKLLGEKSKKQQQ